MKRTLAFLFLAVQLAALGGLYAWHARSLATAPILRLRTVPVDPRDLLRGDYVILRFEISTLPAEIAAPPSSEVWVGLEERDGRWQIVAAQARSKDEGAPAAGQGRRWAQARYASYQRELHYDHLERFYIPEGTGRDAPPGGKLEADAALRADGVLVLRRLYDAEGRPWPR